MTTNLDNSKQCSTCCYVVPLPRAYLFCEWHKQHSHTEGICPHYHPHAERLLLHAAGVSEDDNRS